MPRKSKTDLLSPLPGIQVPGRIERIEIRLIPALNDIVGSKAIETDPGDHTYIPARTLYLTKNEDGTYAVMNQVGLVEPEVARIREKWVVAAVVRFAPDQAEQEALFRAFLQVIEPARRCVSAPQLTEELLNGSLDNLARSYATERCTPGCWGMYRDFFSNNELPKSTFNRLKNPDDEPEKPEKPEKPTENNNRKPPGTTPEGIGQEDIPESDKVPRSNNTATHLEGEQHELFDKLDESTKPDLP